MFNKFIALVALIVSALTLSACTTDTHNQADVTFAQMMIPHHEQAIEMAKLAPSRAADPKVKKLATQIEGAQDPEITLMTTWLKSWDETVSMDATDHGMGQATGQTMPGLMTESQMDELTTSTGADFDRLFLTLMIEHHQGAIDMAKSEQADGSNAAAIKLAERIETAQTAEIATMRTWLK